VGGWGAFLSGFVDGAFGVPGLYFAAAAVPLWIVSASRIRDEQELEPENVDERQTDSVDSDEHDTDSNEEEDELIDERTEEESEDDFGELTDIGGIGPTTANRLQSAGIESVEDVKAATVSELAEVHGIGRSRGDRIKSHVSGDEQIVTAERGEADSLTDIEGIDDTRAEALRKAGYTTVDDIRAATRSKLTGVVGGRRAARIKAHVKEESPNSATVDPSEEADTEQNDESDGKEEDIGALTDVFGVGSSTVDKFRSAGFESLQEIESTTVSELVDATAVGEATVRLIKSNIDEEPDARNDSESEDDSFADDIKTSSISDDTATEVDTDRSADNVESASGEALNEWRFGIDEETAEDLTSLDGIDDTNAEALIKEGYTAVDEIAGASVSELSDVVGQETAADIKAQLRFEPADVGGETSGTRGGGDDKSGTSATGESAADTGTTSTEKSSRFGSGIREGAPSSDAASQGAETIEQGDSDTVDGSDERLSELEQSVESHIQAATTDPFDDLDETRAQLVQAHNECVLVAELTASRGDTEQLDSARELLSTIESQLDTVSELYDPLRSARARAPVDDTSLGSVRQDSLEVARNRYESVIDQAKDEGFDTEEIEREYDAVVAELEERARDEVLRAVETVADEIDGVPTLDEVVARTDIDEETYQEMFDSWTEVIESSNIDAEAAFVGDLRAVEADVAGPFDEATYRREGRYEPDRLGTYFGSWSNALEAAFDEDELTAKEGRLVAQTEATREDYVDAIQRVATSTDNVVKSTDVREQSPYSVNEIVAEFGSWQNALDAAGVDNEARLLQELRRVAEEVGHEPTTTEMNEHGKVSASMYNDYFGSYTAAVEKALAPEVDGERSNEQDQSSVVPAGTGRSEGDGRFKQSGELPPKSVTGSPDPDYATIDDISEDARLARPIPVRVRTISSDTGEKKDVSLHVEDLEGDRCWLNVWEKHDVDVKWKIGHWYVLEHARGKLWTNKRGKTDRQLSTTRDFRVFHVGRERPEESLGQEDRPSLEDESDRTEDVPGEEADSTPLVSTEETPGDSPPETDEDAPRESEDILGEIMSEFEDLSDEKSS
jgi:predicted flap endonuclease-1-like 5' DNA nuclease